MTTNFRPLRDLILVKQDPTPGSLGLLILPQGVLKQGDMPGDYHDTFTGTVVAVGPGDRKYEWACSACYTAGYSTSGSAPICPDCGKSMRSTGAFTRHPMLTKVGDRVIYPRRPNSPGGTDEGSGEISIKVDGERYLLFHEEQSAFGILAP